MYKRKSEFAIDSNPKYKSKAQTNHVVYVTAQDDLKSRVNLIAHSKMSAGRATKKFDHNPEINSKDPRPSRYSIPFWEENRYLRGKPLGFWHMSTSDKKKIRNFNQKYERKKRKRKQSGR